MLTRLGGVFHGAVYLSNVLSFSQVAGANSRKNIGDRRVVPVFQIGERGTVRPVIAVLSISPVPPLRDSGSQAETPECMRGRQDTLVGT